MENVKPPEPTNIQAFTEYMEHRSRVRVEETDEETGPRFIPTDILVRLAHRLYLEERTRARSYPTRYVVLYQDLALSGPAIMDEQCQMML